MKMRMPRAFPVLLLLASISCTREPADSETPLRPRSLPAVESAVLDLVNQHRDGIGLAPLSYSAVAYTYAGDHTDYMIATGTLSHHDFDSRASRIAADTNAKQVAENVARNYADAGAVLAAWLVSDSHRTTLEGNFTHTAVSVKEAPDGTLYFTQLFYLQ